jgi:hypothetical protein
MPRGAGTKRARESRSKRTSENREIPELRGRVASRAYQLFENRGRIHGQDLEDWFRAEQEVLSGQVETDLQ